MYIKAATCISPQQTFPEPDLDVHFLPENNKLWAKEPRYDSIAPGVLRRMGKAGRFGVGTASPLLCRFPEIQGIIIGTGNGGMEDCIKFLNQIIQYDEGTLTPTNFVQSTPNAIAAQLGLMAKNKGYNVTHVHRGLSFENALLDAKMLLSEYDDHTYLLGGVEEISDYNYNIESLGGWYKKETISHDLYDTGTEGSIAGEGAAMFIVNNNSEQALAKIAGIKLLHSENKNEITEQLQNFLSGCDKIDLLLSGENGDVRFTHFYDAVEDCLSNNTGIARFKHITGEYPGASSAALWFATHFLKVQSVPEHMIKAPVFDSINNILIYNNYKGKQHSFILITKP